MPTCAARTAAISAPRATSWRGFERFGHPRLRARHLPFAIGIRERDQWVACMKQAMCELGVAEPLRARLVPAFFSTADWMRNRAESAG